MNEDQARYAPKLARFAVLRRTFVPLQTWRLAVINPKMLDITRRNHSGGHQR